MSSALENLVASMTIAELAQRSGKSVEAIANYALGSSTSTSRKSASNGASPKPAKKTKRGRRAAAANSTFDEKILAAIQAAGGEARSVDIEGRVGGTTDERRAALHRLVAAKKLKRSGVARATRYAVR